MPDYNYIVIFVKLFVFSLLLPQITPTVVDCLKIYLIKTCGLKSAHYFDFFLSFTLYFCSLFVTVGPFIFISWFTDFSMNILEQRVK